MRRVNHRALVVGAGRAGQAHVEALENIGVDVVGPVSGIATMGDPVALRDGAIDVVHVATANDLHAPLASEALQAGKHVVCEKPLASDLVHAEELAALARSSATRATVCLNYRFVPLIAELAARIAAGELGTIHLARGAFLQDWLLLVGDDDWRIDMARGGVSRAVADLGVHWVDLVEVITGRHVEAVVAQVGYLHGRRTEDHAGLLVRFAGGLQGICVLSQATAGHRNDLELSLDGTAGSATWRGERKDELWLGGRDRAAVIVTRRDLRFPAARALAAGADVTNEGRRNLFAAFYAWLDGRPPAIPLPTFDDGLRHVRFASAAIISARRNTWVEIENVQAPTLEVG
jgi:predicted dehydrogenase